MKLFTSRIALLLFAILTISTASKCTKNKSKLQEEGLFAEIETTKGKIMVELFFEKTPLTITNFVGLAEGTIKNDVKGPGEPYYDGLVFHRVMDNFMIQGGDPTGTGSGGPGYSFPDEIVPGELIHDTAGILSMANSGPHTNGSQFFITHNATAWLNGVHTVFGQVKKGQGVVDSIVKGDKIVHISIIRSGKAAEAFVANDETFAALKQDAKKQNKVRFATYMKTLATELAQGKEVHETGEGLYYFISEQGDGPKPTKGQTVSAKYHGKFDDGRTFDQGEYSFELITGSVVEGWHLGFAELNKGTKATLVIPYWYGYGEQSQFQGQMPGRSTLVFDVELVDIK